MTTTVEIETESRAVERAVEASGRAGEILLQANRIVVNADTLEDASQFLRGVKTLARQIETERKALTDPLRGVISRIMEKFAPATDALESAERVVKGKLTAYATEVERARQEAERIAREAQRKEEERLRKLAEKAEARGDDAKAEQFAARAEQAALAPVTMEDFPAAPDAAGLSFATTYGAEVTDLRALAAAVVAGSVPELAICADMKYLNATARATKGAMSWPGVKWIATKVARQRA